MRPNMSFDIYVWSAPRDLDADAARDLVMGWEAAGGDPADSPFEPTTDVGWFYRELTKDMPDLDAMSDGERSTSTKPIWLATEPEQHARIVGINVPRNSPEQAGEVLEEIYGLAVKYDVVVFEPGRGAIHLPHVEMGEYASATFWPRGAIRTVVAIVIGAAVAVGAWLLGIPLLSGAVALFAALMVGIFVVSLVAEGRTALRRRGSAGDAPPS
jgi:hypothetical protein